MRRLPQNCHLISVLCFLFPWNGVVWDPLPSKPFRAAFAQALLSSHPKRVKGRDKAWTEVPHDSVDDIVTDVWKCQTRWAQTLGRRPAKSPLPQAGVTLVGVVIIVQSNLRVKHAFLLGNTGLYTVIKKKATN